MFMKMPGPVAPEEFLCLGTTSADGKRVEIFECKPKSQVKAVAANKLTECAGPVGVLSDSSVWDSMCGNVLDSGIVFLGSPFIIYVNGSAFTGSFSDDFLRNGTTTFEWTYPGTGIIGLSIVLQTDTANSIYYAYTGVEQSDCGLTMKVQGPISNAICIVKYDPNVAILNQVTLSNTVSASAQGQYYPNTPVITADRSSVSLACNESCDVIYDVSVSTTKTPESLLIEGTFSLTNPTDKQITLVSLSAIAEGHDPTSIASGPIILGIGESQDFPYIMFVGYTGSLTQNLKYTAELALDSTRPDGVACISSLKKSLSGSVLATDAVICTYYLNLLLPNTIKEELHFNDPAPQSVSRTVTLGPYASAGTFVETASANVVAPGAPALSSSLDVQVTAGSCVIYCVRTQGYWSQNASGPRYDAAWNLVGGPNAPFYLSNQTWLQVLNTSATSGTYYIAAYQFIPARLNSLKAGQPLPTAVQAAWDYLDQQFQLYKPLQMSKLSKTQQADIKAKAKILEDFNRGNVSGYPMCA